MYIQLSELKTNPSKYFDLAKKIDIIVTRHGQRLGRIVCEEKAADNDKRQAFEELMEMVQTAPRRKQYDNPADDPYYDPIKEARLNERGML